MSEDTLARSAITNALLSVLDAWAAGTLDTEAVIQAAEGIEAQMDQVSWSEPQLRAEVEILTLLGSVYSTGVSPREVAAIKELLASDRKPSDWARFHSAWAGPGAG